MIKKSISSFAIFSVVFSKTMQAAVNQNQDINWFMLVVGLFGGLALFLYGMEKMSTALKKSAGDQMRKILAKLTNNRFLGIAVGAFVTMVIQSSSATTVMLVSFVQSGLMNFSQSLGIILGANIGTTVTAQLIAFKLTDYSILMIALGFALRSLSKKESWINLGEVILGFGLLFYGMDMMSSSMSPLRTYPEFINLLKQLDHPIAGMIVGAIFTALIQSSSAFTGIIIVLSQQNLVSLDAGIAMIIGANIGTCVTAGLASLGATREAKRVALGHVFFNLGGALLFIFIIPWFSDFVSSFGGEPARKIANAHTIFNLLVAVIFVPFTGIVARMISRILPLKEKPVVGFQTHYLNSAFVTSPITAIDLAVAEVIRATEVLQLMLTNIIKPFIAKEYANIDIREKQALLKGIELNEMELDFLENEIAEFLIRISREGIGKERTVEVFGLLSVINDIESIGDIIYDNLVSLISKKENLEADFSSEGRVELVRYHSKILKQLTRLHEVLENKDAIKAIKILVKAEKYVAMENRFRRKHFTRINEGKAKTIITHRVHIELFDALKQIEVYLENIAKTIAETSPFGEQPMFLNENENTPK